MTEQPAPRDAVLVIRVWAEPGPPPGFRSRMIGTDLTDPTASLAVSDPEEVLAAVSRWLDGWWRATHAS